MYKNSKKKTIVSTLLPRNYWTSYSMATAFRYIRNKGIYVIEKLCDNVICSSYDFFFEVRDIFINIHFGTSTTAIFTMIPHFFMLLIWYVVVLWIFF